MKKIFFILALSMLACSASNFFSAPTPMPIFDPNSLGTYVAGTANAAFTQTAFFITPSSTPTLTPVPTRTATPITPTATSFFYAVPTLAPSTTPSGYEQFSIEYLRSRAYGGGELETMRTVREQKNYSTYLVKYPSDGLTMYALAHVPRDTQIRQVVITIHGYADTNTYDLYEDHQIFDRKFVQEGFIVLRPAMRNYPPSSKGDNRFRVGQTIDVLNLIAILREQSGKPGLLQYADEDNIGVQGSSTGGGVVLRALTVDPGIKAAVILASISGDERRNIPLFARIAGKDPQFSGEILAPDEVLKTISPASYYELITAPVLIVHGSRDPLVPLEWAQETSYQLQIAGVDVEFKAYEKMSHAFSGPDRDDFLERAVGFLHFHLR